MVRILLPVQFAGYSNRADKTLSLRFGTQELPPAEVAKIHGAIDTFGYLYFKAENELTEAERSELDALETDMVDNPKSKGQRQRNVLFRIWEKQPQGFTAFKDYYAWRMDQNIKKLKDELQQMDV